MNIFNVLFVGDKNVKECNGVNLIVFSSTFNKGSDKSNSFRQKIDKAIGVVCYNTEK